jgi:hypothetical protein
MVRPYNTCSWNVADVCANACILAEVKNMEKGGGKGAWSAYKAAEMAKVYEKKGGGYEGEGYSPFCIHLVQLANCAPLTWGSDTGKNPNSAEKGDPKPKKSAVESGERKSKDAPVGAKKAPAKKTSSASKDGGEKKTKSSTQKKTTKEPAKGERTQPKRSKKK